MRRRVERQSHRLKIGIAADIVVTAVIGGGAIALAVRSPQPDMLLLAGATWSFISRRLGIPAHHQPRPMVALRR